MCVNRVVEADNRGRTLFGGFSAEGSVSYNISLLHRYLFNVCLFHFARKDEPAAEGHWCAEVT